MASYFAVPKLIGFVPVSETYSVHTAMRGPCAHRLRNVGVRTRLEHTDGADRERRR